MSISWAEIDSVKQSSFTFFLGWKNLLLMFFVKFQFINYSNFFFFCRRNFRLSDRCVSCFDVEDPRRRDWIGWLGQFSSDWRLARFMIILEVIFIKHWMGWRSQSAATLKTISSRLLCDILFMIPLKMAFLFYFLKLWCCFFRTIFSLFSDLRNLLSTWPR